MWLIELRQRWMGRMGRTRRQRRRQRTGSQTRIRPSLEPLEDRTLLTAWTSLGPAPLTGEGLVGNGSTGTNSGRVTGIATDPSNANIVYLATAGGGIWKTTNATAASPTWTPLVDSIAGTTDSMGAIAIAPSNSSVLYAGTGEANNSADSNYGEGILVSTNAGSTWTLENPGGVFTGLTTSKIAVDPTNANIAYAAMGNVGENKAFIGGTGIYKTTDGGVHWTNMTGSISTTDSFSDVAVNPTSPSTIYAAVGNLFGDAANGIYESTNGGTSWTELTNFVHGSGVGRISLALAPSNPSVIYGAAAQTTGAGAGLLAMEVSTNGGSTWTDHTGTTPNFPSGQGWYDLALTVNPTNSSIVYAGGAGGPEFGEPAAVIVSTNSGASWTDLDLTSRSAVTPHADHHAFAFDANGNLLDGDDGGIFRLTSLSPITWQDVNGNLSTIQFESISINPSNGNVLGGSQDNGTDFYNATTTTWTATDGGDGGFAFANSTLAYHDAPVGSFGANFFRVSSNGGLSWSTGASGLNDTDPMNFYAPFTVDPGNANVVVFGSNQIYVTSNAASSWTKMTSTGLNGWNPSGNDVDAIGLSSSSTAGGLTIYAATGGTFANSSQIFVSTNGGTNWTEHDLPAGSGRVNQIIVDPGNSQIAYAVVSTFTSGAGHVWKTTNGGTTWTDMSGNLPNLPTWTIQLDATNQVLYVGNDNGVYTAPASTSTWSQFGTGLPNAQVFSLNYSPTLTELVAGTHGRGAWEISTVATPAPTVTNVTSSTANGTYGTGAVISIQVTFSAAVNVTGTPLLTLNSGGTASYTSGSGTTTLTFTYTVGAGDTTNGGKLDENSTGALALNGGTIKDAFGNNATLTLPADGTGHSLSDNTDIIIDATTATVSSVSTTTAAGTYGTGAVITVDVNFSENVFVTGTPTLALSDGKNANYSSGSGSKTLVFTYTVAAGDTTNGLNLDYTNTTALSGTIKNAGSVAANETLPTPASTNDTFGTKGIIIDATTATVSSVSTTTAAGTYGTGAVITVDVNFSENVFVTGTPTLALSDGKNASYSSGSGSKTLVFTYTVAAGDTTSGANLDYTGTSALSGGTIKNAGGVAANLAVPATGAAGSLGVNKDIVINTVAPAVTGVSATTANGTYDVGAVIAITISFSEAVNVTGTPQLALNSGGTANYASGSGTSTLTFTYTVAAGQNANPLDEASNSALTLNGGTIKDSAGNNATLTVPAPGTAGALGVNKDIIVNTAVAAVTGVSATTPNGTYGVGATITITVGFSKAVNVTGTPQLALNSGGTANYSSGSGTNTLTFTYVVGAGQNANPLDEASAAALTLNGGTISNADGNANLTLPAPATAGSLGVNKDIIVNTAVATVTGVSATTPNGTYDVGAVIVITIGFSESVNVTGTPQLALNSGGTANYSSGSGTSTLTFTYTVGAGQNANPLDEASSTALTLNGGTISNNNGAANLTVPAPGTTGALGVNKDIVVNTAVAAVTGVSATTPNGTYGVGDTIDITISFSKAVNVTGTPQLALNSGGTANYSTGSGTNTLTFVYTVAAGQNANPLDEASTSALTLNGGTISNADGNANLTLPAPATTGSLGVNKDIIINTAVATVTGVSSTTGNGTYGVGAVITITISFNEAVNVTGTPQLALNSGGTASYTSGSGTNTLTFTYTVGAGQNANPLDEASTGALTLNGGTISNANGNANLTVPAPGTTGALGVNKDIIIDTTAPTVVAYYVLFGTQRYNLIGSTRYDLPWQITGVEVVFSKPIASGDVNSLTGLTTTGFSGLGTDTLTWTISPVKIGKFSTTLQGSGADDLKDAAGNSLYGGTGFAQAFNVLEGDFNDDGVVSSTDLVGVYNASKGPYNIFADINGDGVVDLADVSLVRQLIGNHL